MRQKEKKTKKLIEMIDRHNISSILENDLLNFKNLRDAAIELELDDLQRAYTLMEFAFGHKP